MSEQGDTFFSEENNKCSKTTAAGEQNVIFIFRG